MDFIFGVVKVIVQSLLFDIRAFETRERYHAFHYSGFRTIIDRLCHGPKFRGNLSHHKIAPDLPVLGSLSRSIAENR